MQARHPSVNITQALGAAVLLCFSPQVIRGQVAAQTQTFVVHGTPRTCSTITQLDSALSESYQQFFAGWTEKDYVDAVAWSQACSDYGWHIPGHPRLALLQAQHDKSLGQTQIVPSTATAGASPSVPAQGTLAAQVQPAAGGAAASGSALPSPAVPADIRAQAQTVSSTSTDSALPSAPADAAISRQVQSVSSPAAGSALPSPPIPADIPAQGQLLSSASAGIALPSAPVELLSRPKFNRYREWRRAAAAHYGALRFKLVSQRNLNPYPAQQQTTCYRAQQFETETPLTERATAC